VILCVFAFAPVDAEEPERAYEVETIPLPDGVSGETGALAFTPDGRLVAAFHRGGRIFRYDPDTKQWSLFAEGLHEPLGIHVPNNNEVVVMQRPELTRVRDTDGDGFADRYRTITDNFGLSGNYSEFAYGPAVDEDGNYYISLNTASNGAGIREEIRGSFSERGRPGRMYSCVPYRGWVLKVTPSGKVTPWASGFRSPNGISFDSRGRLLVTDNQGDWRGTSQMYHLEKGGFYGHVSSLVWRDGFVGQPLNVHPRKLNRMRTKPVIRFPHGALANSPTKPVEDTTGGGFGPFAGQLFVGEMNRQRLLRVMWDEVAGHLQGASAPFLDGVIGRGNHRMTFGPKGRLWVGRTARKKGWVGGRGIKRVRWTGRTPMEVQQMELTESGFDLTFTRPVDRSRASKPSAYAFDRYYYEYHRAYGSDQHDFSAVPVSSVRVGEQGKRVSLQLEKLKPGYVYQLELKDLTSRDGTPVRTPRVYYTLNYLVDGTTDTPQFNN